MTPYEIYAIRYVHNPNARRSNNFSRGDPHDGPMPLGYFVWAIKGGDGTFILDTGFDAATGVKCQRQMLDAPAVGLRAIGVQPDQVKNVIPSHMHYDHCGKEIAGAIGRR